MLCRGWAVLFIMFLNLCRIQSAQWAEQFPAHSQSSLSVCSVSLSYAGSDDASPADGCKADCTFHQRLVEDTEHIRADIEGYKKNSLFYPFM